jgi:hypothetical protein
MDFQLNEDEEELYKILESNMNCSGAIRDESMLNASLDDCDWQRQMDIHLQSALETH